MGTSGFSFTAARLRSSSSRSQGIRAILTSTSLRSSAARAQGQPSPLRRTSSASCPFASADDGRRESNWHRALRHASLSLEVRRNRPGSHSAHRRGRPVEWVGGRITLPVYITEGQPYRPEAVMWFELPSELVLGFSMIDPTKSPPSFSDTLRGVLSAPLAGPPRRPTRVRVADQTLAAEARAALGDAGGTEVVVAPTPELDELAHQFARSLPDGDEQESYLEDGRVSAAAVERLFRAAKVL